MDIAREAVEFFAAEDFAGVPRDGNWLMSMWSLGIACAALNDVPRVRALYEILVPFASRWACSSISTVFGPIASVLGTLAARLKLFDEAEAYCTSAIERTHNQGTVGLNMYARRAHAGVLYLRRGPGDDERATALLDGIIASARGLGTLVIEEEAVSFRDRIAARAAAGA
jgi:hypothetical protein